MTPTVAVSAAGWRIEPPVSEPMRQRRLEGGQRGGAATAGTAGHPVGVPRVAGRAVGRVLGRAAHGELVHVGLAEDRDAGGAQPGGHRRVVGRHPALEDLRPAGGRHVGGGEDVLERQRHPGQRGRQLLPGGDGGVDAGGLASASSAATCRKAWYRSSVAAIWSRQAWVTSTEDSSLAAILRPSVAASRRIELAHRTPPPPGSAAPRTGRRPRPAPRRAPRPGSGTARPRRRRVTLTSASPVAALRPPGAGCRSASTSVTSTAWIWLTCSKMASSWPAKLTEFLVGQRQPGQLGQPGDLVAGDLGHGAQA